jgi:hypothetical protein
MSRRGASVHSRKGSKAAAGGGGAGVSAAGRSAAGTSAAVTSGATAFAVATLLSAAGLSVATLAHEDCGTPEPRVARRGAFVHRRKGGNAATLGGAVGGGVAGGSAAGASGAATFPAAPVYIQSYCCTVGRNRKTSSQAQHNQKKSKIRNQFPKPLSRTPVLFKIDKYGGFDGSQNRLVLTWKP